jgi:hypothetical protein
MARLTDSERAALVDRFMAGVEHMTAEQLKELRLQMNRRMAAGRNPIEADLQANYDVLLRLGQRIKQLEREQPPVLTLADELRKESERLAREHHVSIEVAERYAKRHPRWDVMRKDIRPAPPPEPAETEQPGADRERPDLRPYRTGEDL